MMQALGAHSVMVCRRDQMLAVGTGKVVAPYRAKLLDVQQLVKHDCLVHICTEHSPSSYHLMTLLVKDKLVLLLDPFQVKKVHTFQLCFDLAKAARLL